MARGYRSGCIATSQGGSGVGTGRGASVGGVPGGGRRVGRAIQGRDPAGSGEVTRRIDALTRGSPLPAGVLAPPAPLVVPGGRWGGHLGVRACPSHMVCRCRPLPPRSVCPVTTRVTPCPGRGGAEAGRCRAVRWLASLCAFSAWQLVAPEPRGGLACMRQTRHPRHSLDGLSCTVAWILDTSEHDSGLHKLCRRCQKGEVT